MRRGMAGAEAERSRTLASLYRCSRRDDVSSALMRHSTGTLRALGFAGHPAVDQEAPTL